MSTLILKPLTEDNFSEFARMINCEDDGCYCSFWHQKWASMEAWDKQKATAPEKNKACVLEKVRAGFHVGVLAYRGRDLVAWISVGPLPDFYWAWRRLAQVGESGKTVAGITCLTRAVDFRDSVAESELLFSLREYGKEKGWTSIEGYPFDETAIAKHGVELTWPGHPQSFERAGFARVSAHWLSSPDYERSIFQLSLNQ